MPHAHPDIGVHDIDAGHRFPGIFMDGDLSTSLCSNGLSPRQYRRIGCTHRRTGKADVESDEGPGKRQRMSHVVGTAQIGKCPPFPATKMLLDRQHISQTLGRMSKVREPVDDGNRGIGSKLNDVGMLEDTCHDDINIA